MSEELRELEKEAQELANKIRELRKEKELPVFVKGDFYIDMEGCLVVCTNPKGWVKSTFTGILLSNRENPYYLSETNTWAKKSFTKVLATSWEVIK